MPLFFCGALKSEDVLKWGFRRKSGVRIHSLDIGK